MAVDHHHDDLVTRPGEVVDATIPEQSETREGHHSTGHEALASFIASRRLVLRFAGAGALVLAGAGTVYGLTRGGEGDTVTPTTTDTDHASGPETGPAFEKELTLNQMKLPETLDAVSYGGVVANLGLAIQYAVNNGDAELIRRLIPGGHINSLQPGQFELRAAFLEGYRKSSEGTMNDDDNNPNNTKYYPWGFKMELIEMLNRKGEKPTDKDVTGFIARVRIVMGDLPPLTTEQITTANVERVHDFEVEAAFTRIAKINKDGTYAILPDLGGKGRGWGLANTDQMYPVPKLMEEYLPKGFDEVPDLYKKSAL